MTPTGDRPQLHEVDRRLGVPGALAHAALDRAQRQDVAGAMQGSGVASWSASTAACARGRRR